MVMTSDSEVFGQGGPSKNFQNNSLTSVIDSYTRYYASGSSHTARAKRLDLDHFLDFLCSLRGCSKPEKLKVRDWDFSSVQRFVEESLSKGEAPATVARRLATIKHMGRTLSEKIRGFTNPAREVKPPKVQTLKPKAISVARKRACHLIAFETARSLTF
jgi:site-specific recombinase XerC